MIHLQAHNHQKSHPKLPYNKAFNVRYKSLTATELMHWLQWLLSVSWLFNLHHFNQVPFLRGQSCPSPRCSPKGLEGTRSLTPGSRDSHPLQPGTSSFTHLAEPPGWNDSAEIKSAGRNSKLGDKETSTQTSKHYKDGREVKEKQ